MPIDSSTQVFMRELVAAQPRLFAYVTTLLCDVERAQDTLQKANVVMIEKMDEFNASNQNFIPWALNVCRFEILAERRDRARDRLEFGAETFAALASSAVTHGQEISDRQRALSGCLEKLPSNQRTLIEQRYAAGGSVEALAQSLKRPAASISQTLYRIRVMLLDCMRRSLVAEASE